jgi:hypothetical protein
MKNGITVILVNYKSFTKSYFFQLKKNVFYTESYKSFVSLWPAYIVMRGYLKQVALLR